VSDYRVSTDPALLDVDLVHRFLSEESYWAKGRSREVVERSIEHSLNFGAYLDGGQVGFARVVTDRATFAWLADVFVVHEHRGHGVGKLLVEAALGHPELLGISRWLLGTADAHELYRRYGFRELQRVERFLAIERGDARGGGRLADSPPC
jgi:GNAT superfamily N-acetyltransferase